MSASKITIIIIIIFAIIAGAFFIFGNDAGENPDSSTNDFAERAGSRLGFLAGSGEGEKGTDSAESAPSSNLEALLPSEQGDTLYTNADYGFSFKYPNGFNVGFFKEGDGHMVLVQKDNKSVQIFILPFDEPAPISKARILKDLPNMVIKNEKSGTVVGEKAIAFSGEHESLGDTYEIWFVHNKNLYQVITKIETAQFLVDIMKTWKEI